MQTRREMLRKLGSSALAGGLMTGGTIAFPNIARAAGKTLRLGHWLATDSPHHKFATQFAELVSAKTSGAVTISVFPSEVLGSYPAQLEQNVAGTLDMSMPTTGALGKLHPSAPAVSLPFLFHSPKAAYGFIDGPVYKKVTDAMQAKGVRVLTVSTNGFRNITNSKKAINSPADLAGLHLRVPPVELSSALFKALGADPVAMPYGQVFTALQAKIIDGQENPFVNIYTGKFYQVQKHLAVTKHQFEGIALVISEKTWNSFDEKTKAAVQAAATEATAAHRVAFDEFDTSLAGKLKASGMEFTTPDIAPFKAKAQPVYRQFDSVFGADFVAAVEKAAG